MDSTATDLLRKYSAHVFDDFPTIPLYDAAFSLQKGKEPLVSVKMVKDRGDFFKRWMYMDEASSEPAIFSFAARITDCTPNRAGNFVPRGEQPPVGLNAAKAVSSADYKAKMSWSFETITGSNDALRPSFTIMEDYVRKREDWSLPSEKVDTVHSGPTRRSWMNPRESGQFFTLQFPLFATEKELKDLPAPDQDDPSPHPWVTKGAIEHGVTVRPGAPSMLRLGESGDLIGLTFIDEDNIRRGDIVYFTGNFAVSRTKTAFDGEFLVLDMIRVARTNLPDTTGPSVTALGKRKRIMPTIPTSGPNASLSTANAPMNVDDSAVLTQPPVTKRTRHSKQQ